MDTLQLLSAIQSDCPMKSSNIGVFAADLIPNYGQLVKFPLWFIANTQKQNASGEHWVLMYADSSSLLEYFDTFGNGALSVYQNFTSNFAEIIHNERIVQGPTTTTCGMHCLYYAFLRCRGLEMQRIIRTYSQVDTTENDRMVERFYERVFKNATCLTSTCLSCPVLQTCKCLSDIHKY